MTDTSPRPVEVELVDLDVVQRYSLALHTSRADAAELAEVLKSDLAWVLEQLGAPAPRGRTAGRGRRAP